MLTSAKIRRWLNSVHLESREMSEESFAKTLARELLHSDLPVSSAFSSDLVSTGDLPEIAYALSEALFDEPLLTKQQLASASEAWRWLASALWPPSEFDEREQVLAALAFVLATRFREARDYRWMTHWEEQCAALLADLEPSRSYLGVFAAEGSRTVDQRVLGDAALLMTFCKQQQLRRNQNPRLALDSSTRAFRLIEERLREGDATESLRYCAADLAISAGVSAAHFQHHDAAMEWIRTATQYLIATPHCDWLLPLADAVRMLILNSKHDVRDVLRETPAIVARLEVLGADRYVMSTLLSQAQAFKTLGLYREAVIVLEDLSARYAEGDRHRLGVAYLYLADAKLEMGDQAGAVRDCKKAYELLGTIESVLTVPTLQTFVGQLLRAVNRPADAVNALREAASTYSAGEFRSWAGYTRILLAETLLSANRAAEALEELVIALGLLEGSEAEQELWAAVKLLRTAVSAARTAGGQLTGHLQRLERIRKGHF